MVATRETATNPEVLDAFALLICAAEEEPVYPVSPRYEPKVEHVRRDTSEISKAMNEIRRLVPKAGACMSESDYFQRDWKLVCWGTN